MKLKTWLLTNPHTLDTSHTRWTPYRNKHLSAHLSSATPAVAHTKCRTVWPNRKGGCSAPTTPTSKIATIHLFAVTQQVTLNPEAGPLLVGPVVVVEVEVEEEEAEPDLEMNSQVVVKG